MASKIARKLMKIFGSTSGTNQLTQYGSLAADAPVYANTRDPDVIQALSAWEAGWYAAVIGGNSPAIQDMNALQYVFAYQLAYLMQQGVAEWQTGTEYFLGSYVSDGLGNMYQSLINNNIGQALSDTTKWLKFSAKQFNPYQATIGAGGNCTHATLALALADANVTTYSRILLRDNITGGASPLTLTKAGWQIDCAPGVTWAKGVATKALIFDAANISVQGLTFSGFSTGGDIAVQLSANGGYGRVQNCKFISCDTEVDDSAVTAGQKPVVLGNFSA